MQSSYITESKRKTALPQGLMLREVMCLKGCITTVGRTYKVEHTLCGLNPFVMRAFSRLDYFSRTGPFPYLLSIQVIFTDTQKGFFFYAQAASSVRRTRIKQREHARRDRARPAHPLSEAQEVPSV